MFALPFFIFLFGCKQNEYVFLQIMTNISEDSMLASKHACSRCNLNSVGFKLYCLNQVPALYCVLQNKINLHYDNLVLVSEI